MKSEVILKVENVGKQYRLGLVGTGTLSHDLNRWWSRIRGKEDPYLRVGETNVRSEKGDSEYVWAIQNINFEVNKGEVLGIIGKNGAGKSTLLKILSRVTSPTTGEIKTNGKIASLLEVGTGFHPEMTGRENIYLNGAILGMTNAEINLKIKEIIEFSGCLRYVDTPVKRYSSGMRVRLAFAVAAFLEPDILVVDEVLAVGDIEFQKKAIGKMQDISTSDGRTVLFVSHNMASVRSLCSRTICLENGEIAIDTNTPDAINFYLRNSNKIDFKAIKINQDNFNFSIDDIGVYADDQNNSPIIKSGDFFKLKIDYKCNQNIDEFHFAVHIENSEEMRCFTLSPRFYGKTYKNIGNSGSISCFLDKLPLPQGVYNITIWASINKMYNLYETKCYQFDVHKGDFFGHGILPKDNKNVKFLIDHDFTLAKD
jgi:lipopolysaccharide transport system ATP-binding protein